MVSNQRVWDLERKIKPQDQEKGVSYTERGSGKTVEESDLMRKKYNTNNHNRVTNEDENGNKK